MLTRSVPIAVPAVRRKPMPPARQLAVGGVDAAASVTVARDFRGTIEGSRMPEPAYYVPRTVGAAIAAGWTAIRAECPGHQITELPWTMIPGGRERALADIVRRLRCRRCGKRPADVHLHRAMPGVGNGPPSSTSLPIGHLAGPET